MWNNLPADTTDFSSLRKFCASVTKDYLLTFVQSILCDVGLLVVLTFPSSTYYM